MAKEKIIELIANITNQEKENINDDLQINGIDSVQFIELLVKIEDEFNIEIEEDFFSIERLNSVNKIVEYIEKRKQGDKNYN